MMPIGPTTCQLRNKISMKPICITQCQNIFCMGCQRLLENATVNPQKEKINRCSRNAQRFEDTLGEA